MALSRQQKEERINSIRTDLAGAVSVVFVAYDRLTVAEVNELRTKLYAAGGRMRIVPKRLLRLSLADLQWEFDPTAQAGQLATVWGTDPVAPAKVLSEFRKTREDKIQLLAGVLEGNMLAVEEVAALAAVPPRDIILGQMVSVLAGPARGMLTVLSGVQRNFVQVLAALQTQKQS
ncbi:MAG: 50S ribosomal protein L10 [Candidatus Andersenbacteria bacterium CG10_big_fil_rev_8_21_14_0_10_54_11]|uniref:Large ribosomal subunit protein uL10 n=1 Tax=Candidatus Andersenbacteria bacterium CG10_big_fil_rev_8_21_14_0_10_54_11 TaxID=1974485 RepID=A0A2M6WZY4_9BACT|nr:MAG: 50S ribosomal protein L10 [Candidatus Andersenbacteria bacterium CG10_big_fil_rev_8_21_14_0_10_54_11]